jgi:hypothetical protein
MGRKVLAIDGAIRRHPARPKLQIMRTQNEHMIGTGRTCPALAKVPEKK